MKKLKSADQLDVDLNDLSIVDAGNSQNYLAMAKLMLSEGREIVALLDGDEAGKKIETQLKKICSAELRQKKLSVHLLPKNRSSEDVFADAAKKAYESLVGEQLRKPANNTNIAEVIERIGPSSEKTLGRTMDEQTEACFDPFEKISKLLIATLYEDMAGEDHKKLAPEASLAELKKIKESLKLRGEKSERLGVFEEAE